MKDFTLSHTAGVESAARHRAMLHDPVPGLITRLALPTVICSLITVIYNTADTWFVARIHTSAAAAVGVVFSLMSIIQAFGFGIGMGAGSIISRRLGEKADEAAGRCGSSALFAAFLVGGILLLSGELVLAPLLRGLGATETILVYAEDYTRYILLGAPVMCGTFVLNNILRAQGETFFAMWGIASGGILNVLLDPLFIFVLDMGIGGAAIATILSQLASFLILLSFFFRGQSIVLLKFRWISRSPGHYWLIFSTGLPTICRQGLGSVSTAVLNVLASGYGDAAVAAMTIAARIYMLVRFVILGIGQGMQPAAGYNFGAGDFRRVRECFRFSCRIGTLIGIAAALSVAPFAGEIMGWFCRDSEVVRIGRIALYAFCAVMPFLAYSTLVNQLVQGLGFRLGATVLASCRQGIFFFPAAGLSIFFGLWGLAAIQPAADLCTFLVSWPYQKRFFRRHLS